MTLRAALSPITLLRFLPLLALLTGWAHQAYADCATTSPPTCTYVPTGQTVNIVPTAFTAPSPSCKQITNSTCSADVMVPTGSQAEWTSFNTNHESCLTFSDCDTYSWVLASTGTCSASCGDGTQALTYSCQQTDSTSGTTSTVDNSLCPSSAKPTATSQTCNLGTCPAANVCTYPDLIVPVEFKASSLTCSNTTTAGGDLTWNNVISSTGNNTYQITGTCSGTAPKDATSPYPCPNTVTNIQSLTTPTLVNVSPTTPVVPSCGNSNATGGFFQYAQIMYTPVNGTCQSSTVTVVAPTVTLTASPTTISSGQSSTLTWTVSGQNITSCTASGDSSFTGNVSASGSTQNVSPSSTTTYSVTCTNSGGSTTATAKVSVICKGGLVYNGYCYRTAGATTSCDALCSSYGGANLPGTQAIGSNGTDEACFAVASGLVGHDGVNPSYNIIGNPVAGSTQNVLDCTGLTIPCAVGVWDFDINYSAVTRYTSPTTTTGATSGSGAVGKYGCTPDFQHFCACNN